MSKAAFHVLYDGPALATNEMNVNDLAPALLALGDLLEEANRTINGSKAKVSLNVKASFKTGCFGIELDVAQTLLQQVGALFSSAQAVSAKDLLRWLGLVWDNGPVAAAWGGGLLWLIKKLRGRTLSKVQVIDNGRVRFEIDGEAIEMEAEVIELYRNAKLRKALEEVLRPLERDGIDEFAVTDRPQSARFLKVKKEELPFFAAPGAVVQDLDSSIVETNLQLVSISFRQDNKWRFSEGEYPFYAHILDENFLSRVQQNEPFSSGDRLKVKMRKNQRLVDGNIKIDYEILEVLRHEKGSTQLPMQYEDS